MKAERAVVPYRVISTNILPTNSSRFSTRGTGLIGAEKSYHKARGGDMVCKKWMWRCCLHVHTSYCSGIVCSRADSVEFAIETGSTPSYSDRPRVCKQTLHETSMQAFPLRGLCRCVLSRGTKDLRAVAAMWRAGEKRGCVSGRGPGVNPQPFAPVLG